MKAMGEIRLIFVLNDVPDFSLAPFKTIPGPVIIVVRGKRYRLGKRVFHGQLCTTVTGHSTKSPRSQRNKVK